MNELSLFTGAGGGILGSHLLGWRPIGYVEFNDYCQRVLAQRIKDGYIPEAPIFGDIRAFVSEGFAERYRGMVDIVTAGFPCQPFSVAGKQAAEDDPRNMWPATAEVLRIVRPRSALLENVPGLLSGSHGYFGQILRELAELGYDVRWGVLSAADAGAPHLRKRLWIYCEAHGNCESAQPKHDEASRLPGNVAAQGAIPNPSGDGVREQRKRRRQQCGEQGQAEPGDDGKAGDVADGDFLRMEGARPKQQAAGTNKCNRLHWWTTEPDLGRVANGVANRIHRLRALGNGQVPAVVRLAWETLSKGDE